MCSFYFVNYGKDFDEDGNEKPLYGAIIENFGILYNISTALKFILDDKNNHKLKGRDYYHDIIDTDDDYYYQE